LYRAGDSQTINSQTVNSQTVDRPVSRITHRPKGWRQNVLRASLLLLLALLVSLIGFRYAFRPEAALAYNPNNLIRLHVVANSDSPPDQAVKLKVRDAVLDYLTPYLLTARNRSEARAIVIKHYAAIENVARQTLAGAGLTYEPRLELGRFTFPTKTYGSLTLPAGEYDALRITLGRGEGANWWCVLFPPLCLLDIAGQRGQRSVSVERWDDQALLTLTRTDPREVPFEVRWAFLDLWKERGEAIVRRLYQLRWSRFQVAHLLELWQLPAKDAGGD